MIPVRSWLVGFATFLLGTAPSHAEPELQRTFASITTTSSIQPTLAGDPGCNAGAEACDGASRTFAGSVVLKRIPTLIGPIALVGQGWGMSFRDDRVDISQGIATFGFRGWVAPSFWVQGGIGAAAGEVSSDAIALDPRMSTAILPAAMVGAGFELAANDHFAIDLSLHAGSALDDAEVRVYHVSLGLGCRWY